MTGQTITCIAALRPAARDGLAAVASLADLFRPIGRRHVDLVRVASALCRVTG